MVLKRDEQAVELEAELEVKLADGLQATMEINKWQHLDNEAKVLRRRDNITEKDVLFCILVRLLTF